MLTEDDYIPVTESGCWLWLGACYPNDYGVIYKGRRSQLAHRVMFKQVYGYLPKLLMHSCDVKSCINPLHLSGGTYSENLQDAMRKGKWKAATKELHGSAVLTLKLAREIRNLKGIKTQRALAKIYGVSPGAIQAIHENRTWKEEE